MRIKSTGGLLSSSMLFVVLAGAAQGGVTDPEYVQTLLPSSARPASAFGHAIAADGGQLLIAAPLSEHPGDDGPNGETPVNSRNGVVYFWTWNPVLDGFTTVGGMASSVELIGTPCSSSGDGVDPACQTYGAWVDYQGDLLVVGAPTTPTGLAHPGAVLTYRWDVFSWVQERTIEGEGFGRAVAAFGDRIAFSTTRGEVHVYRWDEVSEEWVLERSPHGESFRPSGFSPVQFGTSIDVDGDTLVIGAPAQSTGSALLATGAVLVYELEEGIWRKRPTLTPFDGGGGANAGAGDAFGHAVALDDGVLVVGAPNTDHSGVSDAGMVYTYEELPGGGWSAVEEYVSPLGPSQGGRFGHAVDVSGPRFIVGTNDESSAGFASVYRRWEGGWVLEDVLLPQPLPLPVSADQDYGFDVAIDDAFAFVSRNSGELQPDTVGEVYAYRLTCIAPPGTDRRDDEDRNGLIDRCEIALDPSLDCDGNGRLDAFEILQQASLDIDMDGSLDACQIVEDPSLDCDANGQLDWVEIAMDAELDVDLDGELDACQVAGDFRLDCDKDGMLDTVQVFGVRLDTGVQPGLDGDESISLELPAPPESTTDAVLIVELIGDYRGSVRYVDIRLNGEFIQRLLPTPSGFPVVPCPEEPYRIEVIIPQETFNQATLSGLLLTATASAAVDVGDCPGAMSRMLLRYGTRLSDCNGNGLLDPCEAALDPFLDLDNNGVLDECESAFNPDRCLGDLNGDQGVDLVDLNLLLVQFGRTSDGTGAPPTADTNMDGVVDLTDLQILLAEFGVPCPTP